jgi:hypothetical protein
MILSGKLADGIDGDCEFQRRHRVPVITGLDCPEGFMEQKIIEFRGSCELPLAGEERFSPNFGLACCIPGFEALYAFPERCLSNLSIFPSLSNKLWIISITYGW